MMIPHEIIQLITGSIGSLCFGILFNMRGRRLIFAAVGGFIATWLFLVLSVFSSSEPLNYFIVSAIVSLYSEIMARILKTPATPVITTALVPLIPGGSLYYTMAYAFSSSWFEFWDKAVYTLKLASALALGIICVTASVHIISGRVLRHKTDGH